MNDRFLFSRLDILARHRALAIVAVFFLSFGGSWLFSAYRGIPVPYVSDEFGYLLAADTFAHGRMTNPPHPMGIHFETFFVLQRPTYMSIYPPGQGFFLALGKIILGHPICGVWLSTGLMCAAICWMLYACVPARWALMGGIVAALQFGIFTYWSQTYWGGAVAAMGGAMVFGALPRIWKFQRLRDALWLGVGISVLIATRPEGILAGIPVGCLVLPWNTRQKTLDKGRLMKNVVFPFVLVVSMAVTWTGVYNAKITGHSWLFPHVLYSKQYSTVPLCLWQPLYPAVHYHYKALADFFHQWNINYYYYKRTWAGFAEDLFKDSLDLGMFFWGYPLAIPSLFVLIIIFSRRKTSIRCLISCCIILFWLGTLTYRVRSHYFAPLTGFVVLGITDGLRLLFGTRFHRIKVGRMVIIFLIGVQLVLNITLTPVLGGTKYLAKTEGPSPINLPASFSREDLKKILLKSGGRYLVIVRYPPWHNYNLEWVHNDADIDHSPVVWAHDMDAVQDKRLVEYFKNRQVLFIKVVWETRNLTPVAARQ